MQFVAHLLLLLLQLEPFPKPDRHPCLLSTPLPLALRASLPSLMLEFQFKALNTKLDYARLTEQLQLQEEEEKVGRGEGRDIAVVRVVLRLGDEDTSPPLFPRTHAVLRHCLAFLSHEQQKLLWDQSDISSGKSRLTSPTSTSTPPPSSAPSSSIYLMPKTFNVIKTDNAENAQNFKARAELKVCEAASESFKIPLRPRSTHLPHPSHTPPTHTHTH